MQATPYRLCLANTITGQVVADLPIGPRMPTWLRQINAPGTFTPQSPLSPALDPDVAEMINEPYKWTVVWAYGNAILQAGLLITYGVDDTQQPPSIQFNTMPMWDFLTKKRLARYPGKQITDPAADIVFSATSPDPANQNLSWGSVAARLVQIATSGGPSYTLPIVTPAYTTGSAAITYAAADLAYVGQRITEITHQDQGPEIVFSPEWVDSTQTYMQWRMRIGTPRLGNLGYPHAWDYQQACQYVILTSDGSAMTFDSVAKGQDNRHTAGGSLIWSEHSDATYPNSGWPALETADNLHASEVNQSVIAAYATSNVNTNMLPAYTGSMHVRADGRNAAGQPTGSPTIEDIAVGDTCLLGVKRHVWLADGQYAARIVGIGSGADMWTAKVDVQMLGGPL